MSYISVVFNMCTDLKCLLIVDSIGNTFCLYVLRVKIQWVKVRGRTYCKIYETSVVIRTSISQSCTDFYKAVVQPQTVLCLMTSDRRKCRRASIS
jgi:hypothetical protein